MAQKGAAKFVKKLNKLGKKRPETIPYGGKRVLDDDPSFVTTENIRTMSQKAYDFAHEKKYEEALDAYAKTQELARPSNERQYPGYIGHFTLKQAACLLDLERYEEAKDLFESKELKKFLSAGELSAYDTFHYFYLYGQVLVHFGDEKELEAQFNQALWVAANELQDVKLCTQVWLKFIQLTIDLKAWGLYDALINEGRRFGQTANAPDLFYPTASTTAKNLRDNGRIDSARQVAEMIISLCENVGYTDRIEQWKTFIDELPT